MIWETGGSLDFEGSRFLVHQCAFNYSLLSSIRHLLSSFGTSASLIQTENDPNLLKGHGAFCNPFFLSVKLIEKLMVQRFDLHTGHNGFYRS